MQFLFILNMVNVYIKKIYGLVGFAWAKQKNNYVCFRLHAS